MTAAERKKVESKRRRAEAKAKAEAKGAAKEAAGGGKGGVFRSLLWIRLWGWAS